MKRKGKERKKELFWEKKHISKIAKFLESHVIPQFMQFKVTASIL